MKNVKYLIFILVLFCLKCSNFLYAGEKSKHYMLIQYYTIEHVNCNELNEIIANAEERLAKDVMIRPWYDLSQEARDNFPAVKFKNMAILDLAKYHPDTFLEIKIWKEPDKNYYSDTIKAFYLKKGERDYVSMAHVGLYHRDFTPMTHKEMEDRIYNAIRNYALKFNDPYYRLPIQEKTRLQKISDKFP